MKKVLFICMSRLGDILQSVHAISGVKKERDVHVSILVRRSFADVLQGMSFVDEVICFDSEKMFVPFLNENYSGYRQQVEDFIQDLSDRQFDEVVNLTFSDVSAYISYLLDAKVKKGMTFSKHGEIIHTCDWSHYFNGTVLNRTVNSINIIDIFKNIAGVNKTYLDPSTMVDSFTEDMYLGDEVKPDDFVFIFQMGASQDYKRWPVNKFAELALLIFEKSSFSNSKIVLIGSEREDEFGKEFMSRLSSFSNRIINRIGKIPLYDLWSVISRANMFISNDTGPIHMAAILGIPIVSISLGPVKYEESGPLGEHSMVITPGRVCFPCNFHSTCQTLMCREDVKSEEVLSGIEILDELIFNPLEDKTKIFHKVVSKGSNFYYGFSDKSRSKKASFFFIPINRMNLTSERLSSIICNTLIESDLTLDMSHYDSMVKEIKRYDYKLFNMAQYCRQILESIVTLKMRVEDAKRMLRLKMSDEDLLMMDVKIAKLQDENEVTRYLLGIFQSFKAGNVGEKEIVLDRNMEIYEHVSMWCKVLMELTDMLPKVFPLTNNNLQSEKMVDADRDSLKANLLETV